jgi:hypothetical protein
MIQHKKTVMGTCKNKVEEEPQPEAGNIVGKEMKKKKKKKTREKTKERQ